MPKTRKGIARLATHGWVLALALSVAALAPLGLLHHPAEEAVASAGATTLGASGFDRPGLRVATAASQSRPVGTLRRYVARRGDSVSGIAGAAGISVGTLMQTNNLYFAADLIPGKSIVVPPVDGTMIRVDGGETLADLAQAFRADPATIRAINALGSATTLPKEVFIPAADVGELASRVDAGVASSGGHRLVRFTWPTHGVLTQYFYSYHPGIDIANDVGTPEVAADAGRVAFAGWGSYGDYVEIDHGNGFHTIYGHMSRVLVQTGQLVGAGEEIGLMGATGIATGPHLHFEIRFNGTPQNPLDLLP